MSCLRSLILVSALIAGCSSRTAQYPACHAGIPLPSQLLADPVFAPLKYHRVDPFDIRRGFGYGVWTDSNFEFRTALEYLLAPRPGGRTEDDLCGYAISLRFALPAEDADKGRLAAFARSVAAGASTDPAALDARLAGVLSSNDKFRARPPIGGAATLEAGRLTHPSRGDFFMVKLTWPKPEPGAK